MDKPIVGEELLVRVRSVAMETESKSVSRR